MNGDEMKAMSKGIVYVKAIVFLAALAAISAAQMKYVAVVETEVDVHSGAAAELNPAEVRQVTTELRREAVKNLPRNKYNIMTSETVYAQGSATLEACADENCVITLGSKIGADYIVRGTISKLQTRFTLSVEIYETEDGNLVASSDPVRSENIGELVEKAAAACAEMYKTFAETRVPAPQKPPEAIEPPPPPPPPEPAATAPPPRRAKPKPESTREPLTIKYSAGGGIFYAGGFGGGIQWDDGEIVSMPYNTAGAYLFLDFTYATAAIGYSQGGGMWETPNNINQDDMPYMHRSSLNIGVYAKYPDFIKTALFIAGSERSMNIYPILGLDYEFPTYSRLEFGNRPDYIFDGGNKDGYDAGALSALWVKFGGGLDLHLTAKIYARLEMMYGARMANWFETSQTDKYQAEKTRIGHGVTIRAGAGVGL